MQSVKKTFRLSSEAAETLEKISINNRINQTALLEDMILTYSAEHNKTAHQVAEELKEYIDKNYGDLMKRFIARTRGLDVNQQIMIDMLNSMAASFAVKKYEAADTAPSLIYTASRKHLAEKIQSQKQKKDWSENE